MEEYLRFSREGIEKDGVGYYDMIYDSLERGLDNFIIEVKCWKLKNRDWVLEVNKVVGYEWDEGRVKDIVKMIGEEGLYKYMVEK